MSVSKTIKPSWTITWIGYANERHYGTTVVTADDAQEALSAFYKYQARTAVRVTNVSPTPDVQAE